MVTGTTDSWQSPDKTTRKFPGNYARRKTGCDEISRTRIGNLHHTQNDVFTQSNSETAQYLFVHVILLKKYNIMTSTHQNVANKVGFVSVT